MGYFAKIICSSILKGNVVAANHFMQVEGEKIEP